jgi:hypothetical protein
MAELHVNFVFLHPSYNLSDSQTSRMPVGFRGVLVELIKAAMESVSSDAFTVRVTGGIGDDKTNFAAFLFHLNWIAWSSSPLNRSSALSSPPSACRVKKENVA